MNSLDFFCSFLFGLSRQASRSWIAIIQNIKADSFKGQDIPGFVDISG